MVKLNLPKVWYFNSVLVTKTYDLISSIIKRLLGLAEFLLFIRLILKFLGANPYTFVVAILYKYTDYLVSPFKYIFNDIYWPGTHLIETMTIASMIGYGLFVFVIYQVLRLFFKDEF